jgi:integrase
MVMAGVDLRAIQALMGHKTITMTLRYAQLAPDQLKRAVEVLIMKKITTIFTTPPLAENSRAV